MTWHTSTTTREQLERLMQEIRRRGGTVASCRPSSAGLLVTWFTR